MILPAKHIKLSQSILGLSGFVLSLLKEPLTIDEIWIKYSNIPYKRFPAFHTFDNVVLAINLLYMIGAISINEEGKIYHEVS